jgi:threonine dehydrogenase-like Zn-dependent dehydrogenase
MRSLSFKSPDDVELVEVPVPEPATGQALVRVEASAICGSELKAPPFTNPGHEAVGIVERAPIESEFVEGERVGISAVAGCGSCEHCRRGVQIYCSRREPATGYQNMHADYVAVAATAVRRLPQGISPTSAVLLAGDTLGVPVRAIRRVPSANGERVLVIGLGPVGLSHTLVRAYAGAEVIAIEPSAYRRQLAITIGAASVFPRGADIGQPPRLVIECTGQPEMIRFALETVDVGGTVLQSGECPMVQVSPSDMFIRREITYTGSWYYADEDYPEMVRLYESGLPLDQLATHSFPARDISKAYQRFVAGESGKVVLLWT